MSVNVLVFCPTFEVNGVDQVRPETLDAIDALDGTFDFVLGKYNPYKHGHMNILHQYQVARNLALDGHTHLLTIEHDMIPPPNALVDLVATGEKVAYGVYQLRHGAHVLNAWRKVKSNHVGMSLSLFPDELQQARHQVVPEVSGVGMGCTFIAREVLELFDFRPPENSKGGQIPDVAFATDCLRAGIKQVAHFGVLCGHIKPDGQVLWPFNNGGSNMAKYKVLVTVNAPGGRHLVEGELVELPDEMGSELARAGYVKAATKPKPAAPKEVAEPKVKKPTAKK